MQKCKSVDEKRYFLEEKMKQRGAQTKTKKRSQAKPSQATGPPRAPPGRLRHYIFMLKRTQTTRQEKKIPADSAEPQPNAHRKKIRLSGASPSLW